MCIKKLERTEKYKGHNKKERTTKFAEEIREQFLLDMLYMFVLCK